MHTQFTLADLCDQYERLIIEKQKLEYELKGLLAEIKQLENLIKGKR